MKSFFCFSVILLARSVVSENIPFCAPAQVKYCVLDDCLQPLINQTTSGPQFCGKYLENDSISIPDYIPAAAPASRISSACSCLIQAQPTAKPTTQSSNVVGSIELSVSTKTFPSLETSVRTIPSAIVSVVPTSPPAIPGSGNQFTTSIIYSLSTYTTQLSGLLVTNTQSVVNSTTTYPVTHEITQSPSPKSTAPVGYTTSIVYTLPSYTNPSGEVITKTIVDYTTVCPVTAKITSTSQALGELASESTTAYETSTIYKISTYTTLGQTITKTLVDYSTVYSITKILSPSPTPKSTVEYTTSTVYSLSTRTYTSSEETFTVTDTVVDYTTVCPITEKSSPTPGPTVQYTTSTVYSLSTSTYITSGKAVTVTNTVVDHTTVCPVTQSASSTQGTSSLTTFPSAVSSTESVILTSASNNSIVPSSVSVSASVSSSSIAVQSTKTRSRHSRTKCTKASHSTQSYPFGNSTSLYRPTGTGSSSPSSISGTAYSSSVRYPMSNSTTSDLPLGTASSTAHQVTDSTRLQVPSGTGYSASSTAYVIANSTSSTSSNVPSGTGYSASANSTTTESLPTSTSSLEINSSTSESPETTEIPITSAPSTTSSLVLPSVTAFCSTDAAALVFAAAGTPVTSYCSSLLSIQPTYADEQYVFVTKTTLVTTTTTVGPATVTVFKRTTRTDPYPFTSTYDLAQQSSACSCLSIQPAVIAETVTITVPATSLVVVSTTIPACTPSPTQVVVNGDFETATSGSYQTPWVLGSLAYVQSKVNNAFTSYSGDKFVTLYGQSSTTATISQQIDSLVPGQSYTLSYYMSVMGVIVVPTASCVVSASVGGVVVDTATITYFNIASYRTSYSQRSVAVVPITQSAQLKMTWQCDSQVIIAVNLLLDNISMVGAGQSCDVSP
ncbi:hypothetical protein BELL_0086g00180 [Botrytis elliptica]|uniref:CBM-cenC domain-containing protein n=1 Tax=Botrytis elliptica TaxID=278938 RepID=A0A4Z1K370_9HELO|nr:hypothetical protein EAE99_004348 [Botrytis elliptica]TGO77912.1 hypothetical protein BELL_0086g00180 [Botrytis elliptica]